MGTFAAAKAASPSLSSGTVTYKAWEAWALLCLVAFPALLVVLVVWWFAHALKSPHSTFPTKLPDALWQRIRGTPAALVVVSLLVGAGISPLAKSYPILGVAMWGVTLLTGVVVGRALRTYKPSILKWATVVVLVFGIGYVAGGLFYVEGSVFWQVAIGTTTIVIELLMFGGISWWVSWRLTDRRWLTTP